MQLEPSARRSGVGRHEVTDEEWQLVERVLPEPRNRRGRPRSHRQMLNGLLWLLRTGAPWRDLPRERFGPWQTVWRRFDRWRREGTLERLKEVLLSRLNRSGELDWELWCVDGTSVRASRAAVGGGNRGIPVSRTITR